MARLQAHYAAQWLAQYELSDNEGAGLRPLLPNNPRGVQRPLLP
jgi:hypothetical protein